MKKLYEKPTVEKIRFNYRDQVVAASGNNVDEVIAERWNNNLLTGCVSSSDIDDYIWSSSIFDICTQFNA